MAGSPLYRVALLQEVVGCLAGASLPHPLAQVRLCYVCSKQCELFSSFTQFYTGLYMYIFMYIHCMFICISVVRQLMALQAVSCPPLDLESLQVPLQPVQQASEDDR